MFASIISVTPIKSGVCDRNVENIEMERREKETENSQDNKRNEGTMNSVRNNSKMCK